MDTIINHFSLSNQIDFTSVIWNYLLTYFFLNPLFIGSCLFVIICLEMLKVTVFKKFPIDTDLYPFVSLGLSLLAVFLTTNFEFSKNYFFNFILTVSFVDIIYTFLGAKILSFIRSKFNYKGED